MINKIIAETINTSHILGMTFVSITPILSFLIYFDRKKKKQRKMNLGLILINSSVLLSYYLYNDICIISICENYFYPDKYQIYKVSSNIKNNLYISVFSLSINIFFNNIYLKLINISTYYGFLFYNYFKINR